MSKKKEPEKKAYGTEGEYYICATCGKSIPIAEIEGQCICGRKVCKSCSGRYPLCAECGWVICRDCAYIDKKTQKYYHRDCLPSRCLIVTACFGSPLSGEVQHIRMFRDKTVRKTTFGKAAIDVFERIYYSFSPQVATYLENHPATKDVVKSILVIPFLESTSSCKEFGVPIIIPLSLVNMTLGLPFWVFLSFLKK